MLASFVKAVVAVVFTAGNLAAVAQDFPSKPITIIDPYPAGGSTDVLSRLIGKRLGNALGQPVIVEAKPGAAGTIGATYVARAAPDGYTLLIGNPSPNAVAPNFYPSLPYDVEKSFAPVIIATMQPMLFCVSAGSPIKSVADLIATGKAGGKISYGSAGNGGISHLTGELLNKATGTRFVHIPYRGAAPLGLAVMTGEVQVGMLSGPDAKAHVQSGKMRCVATAAAQRSALFPDVPTMIESGYPDVVVDIWFGYFAPAGTPRAVVATLQREIAKVLADPEVKDKIFSMGMEAAPSTSERFAEIIHRDVGKYARIIRDAGIKLE